MRERARKLFKRDGWSEDDADTGQRSWYAWCSAECGTLLIPATAEHHQGKLVCFLCLPRPPKKSRTTKPAKKPKGCPSPDGRGVFRCTAGGVEIDLLGGVP